MTINGIALLVWLGYTAAVGFTCYLWGRSDGRAE